MGTGQSPKTFAVSLAFIDLPRAIKDLLAGGYIYDVTVQKVRSNVRRESDFWRASFAAFMSGV